LPLTLQERLRRTNAVSLIQIPTRGYYQPNAKGDQPLTEATLVETLIVMHQHIRDIVLLKESNVPGRRLILDFSQVLSLQTNEFVHGIQPFFSSE
jgi:hypothetical protein